jgi:4-hydroxybenzoate polyprenyltransferase
MPNYFSHSKLLHFYHLSRIQAPTGYLLSFFPAAFGLLLAYKEPKNLLYLPIFLVGSILVRSAGCIINDLLDQDFDKHVARTKNRPLASGAISNKEALIFLALLLSISLGILLCLSKTAIYLGIIAMMLISIYPLMKRFTYFPQVFLGFAFNMGCLIGYASAKDSISYNALILYLACGFWTVGYDTIYGFMDIKDDKKIGVKSTSIFFEHRHFKLVIALCYFFFFALSAIAMQDLLSYYLRAGIILSILISLLAVYTLDIKNSKNCLLRFKINNYIGFILFLAMLLEKI